MSMPKMTNNKQYVQSRTSARENTSGWLNYWKRFVKQYNLILLIYKYYKKVRLEHLAIYIIAISLYNLLQL